MKNKFISAAAAAVVGFVPVAAIALTGSVASAATPTYDPVPFDLANLIANRSTGITATTHFEQTLTDSSGNYWVDTVDGKLIEISKSLPHVAVGYLNLGGGLSLFDAVAIGNTFFIINQGSGTCPVEVVNIDPSNLTLNASTLEYTLVKGSTCIKPTSGHSFGSSSSYSIATDGTNTYFTQNTNASGVTNGKSTLWVINSSTDQATPEPLSVSVGQPMTVANGSLFVGSSSGNDIYQFALSSITSSLNTPDNTYTLTGSGALGDLQYVPGKGELWFVREFYGQVGYINVASTPSQSSIPGTVYTVSGAPNLETESMTLDPTTNNLWIASGNVNGKVSPNVSFGYINPASLPSTGSTTITPTWINTPTSISLGADDFALENGSPTYFDNAPIDVLTKADNVHGSVIDNQNFNFTIDPSIAPNSPLPGSGIYNLVDPMPSGITATAATSATNSVGIWSCNLTTGPSTAGGQGTVHCTLQAGNSQLTAGTQLPAVTITAYATGPVGVGITNTATLSDSCPQFATPNGVSCTLAPPVNASDTITPFQPVAAPSSAPSVTLTKTATQPTASPGGTDSFTIAGAFTGSINAPATVTDTLPAGLSLNGTPTISGSGFASSSCSGVANTVTCTLVPPVAGISNPVIGTITVPVLVASTATGSITNTSTVSDSGDNISPVSARATITVTPPPASVSVSVPSSAPPANVISTVITVPATHTGEPWSAASYWWLVSSLGLAGVILIVPTKRLRKRPQTGQ
ncbi:MAG: hypothetical protein M0T78_01815 [Actinomycetota bacterium]|nr:hypothetical protein [Actinomycetota bacterium]